jgi:hypothetical protein
MTPSSEKISSSDGTMCVIKETISFSFSDVDVVESNYNYLKDISLSGKYDIYYVDEVNRSAQLLFGVSADVAPLVADGEIQNSIEGEKAGRNRDNFSKIIDELKESVTFRLSGAGDFEATITDYDDTDLEVLVWYLPDGSTYTGQTLNYTATEACVIVAKATSFKSAIVICKNQSLLVSNLADFSKVGYFFDLRGTNIVGDIINARNTTSYIHLGGCNNIVGSISNINKLKIGFNLTDTSTDGVINPLPSLRLVYLNNTNLSIEDVDQSVINLDNVTTANDGVLQLVGLQRTSASTGAINSLIAKGWTVTDATVI